MFVKYFVFKTMTKEYYTKRNNRRSQVLSYGRKPWSRMSVSTRHCSLVVCVPQFQRNG
jgi:hypothetical protein